MSNIYLRMPSYKCQFFRNRDPQHHLEKDEPITFNAYMPQHFIIRNSLTNAQAVTQHINDRCYSQQQWRNMLHGCSPLGGKPIMKRDKNEYLTFGEVQQLRGRRDYDKTASTDYLCIRLPYEIEVVDTVRPVTPSWNLDTHGVRELLVYLNNDFKRSVMEWAISTFEFVTSEGRIICRSQAAMLERFLMRYEIEPTQIEKDNLRRIIDRWFKAEHQSFSAYSCLEMKYIDNKEDIFPVQSVNWR